MWSNDKPRAAVVDVTVFPVRSASPSMPEVRATVGVGGGGGEGGRRRRREEEPDWDGSSPYFLGSNEQGKASAGCLVLAEAVYGAYAFQRTPHAAMKAPRPTATLPRTRPCHRAAAITPRNGGLNCG